MRTDWLFDSISREKNRKTVTTLFSPGGLWLSEPDSLFLRMLKRNATWVAICIFVQILFTTLGRLSEFLICFCEEQTKRTRAFHVLIVRFPSFAAGGVHLRPCALARLLGQGGSLESASRSKIGLKWSVEGHVPRAGGVTWCSRKWSIR